MQRPSATQVDLAPSETRQVSATWIVPDDDTQTLVELSRHTEFPDTADKLERALATGIRIVALTIVDRESMLWALDQAPTDGLAELRAVLLRDHEWRVREGLV